MTEELKRWTVRTANGELEDVGADGLQIDGGCLIFKDAAGGLILAYSPSAWMEVSE